MGRASLWVLALAGCVGAEAMTLPPSAAPVERPQPAELGLNPGEHMEFEVRLGDMVAGEAQLAVGEIGTLDGHRVVVVKSRAETVGAAALIKKVIDEATTWVDLDTGRPVKLETLVLQDGKTTTAEASFAGSVANITYVRDDEPKPHNYKIDFGKLAVHDTHSAMAQVRGWKPAPGTSKSVFVVGGRRLWRVDVKYLGEETIGTSLGNRRAVRFEGASYRARPNFKLEAEKPTRTFQVWLSDDADRVPLKMSASTELGDVSMELTDYSRP